MSYSAKVPTQALTTLTIANTWYKICDANTAIRNWDFKAQEATDNDYDFVYNPSVDPNVTPPTNYGSNSGGGKGYANCALPEIWCRSATAGTIIELEYWS